MLHFTLDEMREIVSNLGDLHNRTKRDIAFGPYGVLISTIYQAKLIADDLFSRMQREDIDGKA